MYKEFVKIDCRTMEFIKLRSSWFIRERLTLFSRAFHNTHIGRKLKSRDIIKNASHELTKQKTHHVPIITFFKRTKHAQTRGPLLRDKHDLLYILTKLFMDFGKNRSITIVDHNQRNHSPGVKLKQ